MPVSMVEYLRENYREPEPEWLYLAERTSDAEVRRAFLQAFLQSRIVFYPGSWEDGHPVKLFNQAHAAHAYVYVDYAYTREEVERSVTPHPLSRRRGFRGYRILAVLDVRPEELAPWPPRYCVRPAEVPDQSRLLERVNPFALLYVFERLPEYGEDHGAKRFAVLFLCADGFAAYDALFCQPGAVAKPFCVLLQDYSFFVCYARFGRDGLLEKIASRRRVWPDLLLVADEVCGPWHGYVPAERAGETLEPEVGGMNGRRRTLYKRKPDDHRGNYPYVGRRRPSHDEFIYRAFAWRLATGI